MASGTVNKKDATDRFLAAAREMAERLPAGAVEELARSTESAVAAPVGGSAGQSALTGEPLPSAAELAAVRLRNMELAFADRRRLLQDTITIAEVARLLGVGRQTPHDRLAAGTLLGIKDRGQWRLPLWQFDADGPDGTLPGLAEVLAALRGPVSALGRLRWFVTPKDALDGRTPLEALQAGDVEATVETAAALGAA